MGVVDSYYGSVIQSTPLYWAVFFAWQVSRGTFQLAVCEPKHMWQDKTHL